MPLITDGNVKRGFLRERRLLSLILPETIPKPAYNYAKKIAEFTGLPLEQVLKSEPVRNLINRWREEVVIR